MWRGLCEQRPATVDEDMTFLLLTLACTETCERPLRDCAWCPDTWEQAQALTGDPDYGETCESSTCSDSGVDYNVRTCTDNVGEHRYYYGPDGTLAAAFEGSDVDAGTCDSGEILERWYGEALCD
jgi:hypothetical protein